MNSIRNVAVFLFLVYSMTNSSILKAVCFADKNKNDYLLNFIWIGGDIPCDKLENLASYCNNLTYKKGTQYTINVWTEDEQVLSRSLQKCKGKKEYKFSCEKFVNEGKLSLKSEVVKNILDKSNSELRRAYHLLEKKRIFASAADILRVIILDKVGGCYFDIGTGQLSKLTPKFKVKEKGLDLQDFYFRDYKASLEEINLYAEYNNTNFKYLTDPKEDTSDGKQTEKDQKKTLFINNNFMAAPKNSPVTKRLLEVFTENAKALNESKEIQLFLDKRKFSTSGAVFHLFGPVAFTKVLIEQNEKSAISAINWQGFDYRGSMSWREKQNYSDAALSVALKEKTKNFRSCFKNLYPDLYKENMCGSIATIEEGEACYFVHFFKGSKSDKLNPLLALRSLFSLPINDPISKCKDNEFIDYYGNIDECREFFKFKSYLKKCIDLESDSYMKIFNITEEYQNELKIYKTLMASCSNDCFTPKLEGHGLCIDNNNKIQAYIKLQKYKHTYSNIQRTRNRLSPVEAKKFRQNLREYLSKLHKMGIVHADIHPGNFVLNLDRGKVSSMKLIDFGLSVTKNNNIPKSITNIVGKTMPLSFKKLMQLDNELLEVSTNYDFAKVKKLLDNYEALDEKKLENYNSMAKNEARFEKKYYNNGETSNNFINKILNEGTTEKPKTTPYGFSSVNSIKPTYTTSNKAPINKRDVGKELVQSFLLNCIGENTCLESKSKCGKSSGVFKDMLNSYCKGQ